MSEHLLFITADAGCAPQRLGEERCRWWGTQLLLHHLANKEKVTLQSAVTSPYTSRAGCMASVTESPKDRIPHHTRKEPEESKEKTLDPGKESFPNKLLVKM